MCQKETPGKSVENFETWTVDDGAIFVGSSRVKEV
eukprot:SAG31_NODE_13433_length_869_cov_2.314050_1_plen_34_part_10